MRINKLFLLLLLMVVSVQLFAQVQITSSVGKDFYKGVVRVKFSENMTRSFQNFTLKSAGVDSEVYHTGVNSIDNTNSDVNVFTFKRVFPYSPKFEEKHRKYGLHRWYELTFDEGVEVESVIHRYAEVQGVEIVKPVMKKVHSAAHAKSISVKSMRSGNVANAMGVNSVASTTSDHEYPFSDPRLPDQWHYENFGDIGEEDSDIDLFAAWTRETGSDSVIVAVVDQGVDYTHEDLKDAMWVNTAERDGKPGVDDDENGYVDDVYGYNFVSDVGAIAPGDHGTHVAGTVGAVNNNNIGVAGVAGGNARIGKDGKKEDGEVEKGVRIMGLQIYTESGASGGAAQAYVYAADNGAVIAQSSWGYTMNNYSEPEVMEAIEYFIEEAGDFEGSKMKGGACFFTAGNATTYGKFYPAASDLVIGVTATGSFNTPSSYTNYHEVYDIAAPGGNLDLEDPYDDRGTILSCLPNNEYGYMQGTSMACPHVSGVAALIVSMYGDEDFTAAELEEKLLNYTTPFSSSKVTGVYAGNMGVGHLNALNPLLENEGIAPDSITQFWTDEPTFNRVELGWIVPADEDDEKPTTFEFALSEGPFDLDDFAKQELFTLKDDYSVGDTVTAKLSGLNANTDHYISIRSYDLWNNVSKPSEVIQFNTLDLPVFSVSKNEVKLTIDVSENSVGTYDLVLANKGEGAVDWTSDVYNRGWLWPESIDSTKWGLKDEEEESMKSASILSTVNSTTLNGTIDGTNVVPDYYDRTAYKASLYNDPDIDPQAYYGDLNNEQRLTYATRFSVPVGHYFNMTHIEAWMNISNDSVPIRVELRKGKVLGRSEIIGQRYYTADTTGVILSRIPLPKPVMFEEADYFWVVLSHPKDDNACIITNYYDAGYDINFISMDSGVTWHDFREVTASNPQVMKVRAYSVGDDPTYTYIDPLEGIIKGGEQETAQVVVDASQLNNGEHTAYINLRTNDPHFPVTSVDVNILVTGQEEKLAIPDEMSFNDLTFGRENEIEFTVKNEGHGISNLKSIELFNYVWEPEGNDTLVPIYPGRSITFTLKYNPFQAGYYRKKGAVVTYDNTYDFYYDVTCKSPATVALTAPYVTEFSILKGEKESFSFSIQNTSVSEILDYNVVSEYLPDGEHARSPITDYEVEYLIDDSRWEDLSEVGTQLNYYMSASHDLGFSFPFYNRSYNAANLYQSGHINFSDVMPKAHLADYPSKYGYRADIGGFYGSWSSGGMVDGQKLYTHSFGDHFVFSVENFRVIPPEDAEDEEKERYENQGKGAFQIALFKDGAIEVRYHKVDSVIWDNAIIGLQDPFAELYESIKLTDTTILNVEAFDKFPEGIVPDTLVNGTVIRFTPNVSANFLSKLSHDSGRLLPGESQDFTVEIDEAPSDLKEGTHVNTLKVETNSLTDPAFDITLNVTGKFDSLRIDTTRIQYGLTYTDFEYVDTLYVTSWGSIENKFIGIETDIETITVEGMDDPLKPDEIRRLLVTYQATKAQLIDSTTNTVNNVLKIKTEQGDLDVQIFADTRFSPDYNVDKNNFVYDLSEGKMKTGQFVLTNESATTDLIYQISSTGIVALKQEQTVLASTNSSIAADDDDDDDEEDETRNRYDLPHSAVGDSCFAYSSSQFAGVDNYYEEISGNGERLIFTKDEFIKKELPFNFPFMGGLYNSIFVSENGYISVVQPKVVTDPFTGEFAKKDDVSGMIAPMWGNWDIEEESTGKCYIDVRDSLAVIEWKTVSTLSTSNPGEVTFQLIIMKDGRIRFQYKDIQKYEGYFQIGIESVDEEVVMDMGYPTKDLAFYGLYPDGTTIQLNPLLYGRIEPNQQKTFEFEASPSYLMEGDYSNEILIQTNSTGTPETVLTVNATVADHREVNASEEMSFGEMYYDLNKEISSAFYVANNGNEIERIKNITIDNIPEYKLLYNEEELPRYFNDDLINPIVLQPGNLAQFTVVTGMPGLVEDESKYGDFGKVVVKLSTDEVFEIDANIVVKTPPSFTTTMTNQLIEQFQFEDKEFSFEVTNTSEEALPYGVYGAYKGMEFKEDEMIGKPAIAFDSLQYDVKKSADSFYSNFGGEMGFVFSVVLEAPKGGMDLTHAKAYLDLNANKDKAVKIRIAEYVLPDYPDKIQSGGDSLGIELYSGVYRLIDDLGEGYRYFRVPGDIHLEEGKKYIYSVIFEPDQHEKAIMGLETCNDKSIAERYYFQSGAPALYTLLNVSGNVELGVVPKIGLVAGASVEGFVELSHTKDTLEVGETREIKGTIIGKELKAGDNEVQIVTRASNHSVMTKHMLTVRANVKPEFVYTPNADTMVVQEKVPYHGNYMVIDPEGDKVTLTLEDNDGLDVLFEQKEDLETGEAFADFYFNTDWDDEGLYDVVVRADDAVGNTAYDTLQVKITNLNRVPSLVYSAPMVTNLAKGEAFEIDMYDVFEDPDGDDMYFSVGNANPELYTTTLVDDHLLITPIQEGVGYIAMYADDGNETVGFYYYVYVLNDPDYNSAPNGSGGNNDLLKDLEAYQLLTFPNPVVNESNVCFKLEEDSDVRIDLVDMQGRFIRVVNQGTYTKGNNTIRTDLSDLVSGNYFYRLVVDGEMKNTTKVLKK